MWKRTTIAASILAAGFGLAACSSNSTPVAAPGIPQVSPVSAPATLTWGQAGNEDGAQVIVSKPGRDAETGDWVYDVVVRNMAATVVTNVSHTMYADGVEVGAGGGENVAVAPETEGRVTVHELGGPASMKTAQVEIYVNHGNDAAQDRLYWSGPVS
jgi:hypothetical protein